MSGSIQTIPARHGTATFVPKGHSIKIINSSGTQVIDTWAFALHAPPTGRQKKNEESQERTNAGANTSGEAAPKEEKKPQKEVENPTSASGKDTQTISDDKDSEATEETRYVEGDSADQSKEIAANQDTSTEKKGLKEGVGEQANKGQQEPSASYQGEHQRIQSPGAAASSSRWSAYIPSWPSSSKGTQDKNGGGATKSKKAPVKLKDQKQPPEKSGVNAQSSTWSSYIPTWSSSKTDSKPANSKGWSAYIPSGQGFSSYIPSQGQLSAFTAAHARNPNKSYAEQLYDFSKTPVGAAGLSAATGSGYAGSLYAGYSAYNQHHDGSTPMECMSMPHSRAHTQHLRPKVDDAFYSNLREPLMTLTEDTSPGIHDTLIAACDPQRYRGLGVKDWEKHGSCAENLVFALQEFNKRVGLKGSRAVGADVTVNMVPAPLNLFMNIPWDSEGNVTFEAAKCKKGDYVRLRAERDVVVVMSSCPQDVLDINGKKPQAGHFIVEDSAGKPATQSLDNNTSQPTSPSSPHRQFTGAETSLAKLREQRKGSTPQAKAPAKLPPKKGDANKIAPQNDSTKPASPSEAHTQQLTKPTPSRQNSEANQGPRSREQSETPKKKPKKLERRGTPKPAE